MSNWDKEQFINHLRKQCSREVAKIGVSIIDPSGFAINPLIPANCLICAGEPLAPESANI